MTLLKLIPTVKNPFLFATQKLPLYQNEKEES
jgi:hypothetical protein